MLRLSNMRQRAMTIRVGQRHGQATIEFALVCLFGFLPMILGTIELGRGVWTYHQLSQLSREGARYLVVTTVHQTYHWQGNRPRPTDPNAPDDPYIVGTCGCPDTTVAWVGTMANGMNLNQLTVGIRQLNGPPPPTSAPYMPMRGADVEVEMTYPYQPIVATFLNIPATINLTARTVMQLQ